MPQVSVIMNCLDSEKYLRQAIDSVYAQTYRDWEIIFWDNGSKDNSAKIANSYDKRLRYFRDENTVLLGEARNYAIKKASGKYIAFLDCDDMWLPDKLQKQIGVFDNNPGISLVYGNYFWLYSNNTKRIALRGNQPVGDAFEKLLYNYSIGLLTTMLTREVLDALPGGLFDKNLNLGEEYDVFMRITYNSKIAYLNEPLAVYRIHENMSSIRYRSKYPEETKYVLEKLIRLYPEIKSKYSAAIAHLNAYINLYYAKIELLQGNQRRAREILSEHRLINHKNIAIFLSTYLPQSIFLSLVNLRKGLINIYPE